MTLLAGFEALLLRTTGQEDLVVGATIAGRTHREIEGLIGFFVNTLALRIGIAGELGLRRRHRAGARRGPGRLHLPGPAVREAGRGARPQARSFPLADLPGGLPAPERRAERLALPGLAISPADPAGQAAKFDLVLSFVERERAASPQLWSYNVDLFDGATVRRMAGHLTQLLAAGTADLDARLADLPLLSAPERHQLLDRGTGRAYGCRPRRASRWQRWRPGPSCPSTAASRPRPRRSPARRRSPAAESGSPTASWTSRANRLARHLRSCGVVPGVPVGLCLPRSLDMVVAILAVAQGRRRLRAARSGLPGRAARLHARRQPRAGRW